MELTTVLAKVSAVASLHRSWQRVTLTVDAFSSVGPDTFLYVFVPRPGESATTVTADFSWPDYFALPDAERPPGAYYTARAWRPERTELDVWMMLHGDGACAAWAARAACGDGVALWGPRTTWHPPEDTDAYLLVGDDTALPAIAAILEHLPATARVTVIAEVDDAVAQLELPAHPGASVTWLHRHAADAGRTELLAEAVRGLDVASRVYAWGGGESRAMTAVRKHLRHERGLAREQVSMVAYWRHAAHAEDPRDEDD